jgi:hypothetical protein
MKIKWSYFLLFVVAVGCSVDDIVPGGCNFTFDGASYSTTVAVCSGDIGGGTSGTNVLALSKGASPSITFTTGGANIYTNVAATATSLSVSGSKWTFDEPMKDASGAAKGNIKGSCTCTN